MIRFSKGNIVLDLRCVPVCILNLSAQQSGSLARALAWALAEHNAFILTLTTGTSEADRRNLLSCLLQ